MARSEPFEGSHAKTEVGTPQELAGHSMGGDGHFSSKQQLVIAFHSSDSSLAYYLKK